MSDDQARAGMIATAEDADRIARRFHEAYETLAPHYGYETRKESAVPWEDVPDANQMLMRAVVMELLREGEIRADDQDEINVAGHKVFVYERDGSVWLEMVNDDHPVVRMRLQPTSDEAREIAQWLIDAAAPTSCGWRWANHYCTSDENHTGPHACECGAQSGSKIRESIRECGCVLITCELHGEGESV